MQLPSQEREPYLVCLDPESAQIYTLGLLSYNVHIEKDIPPKIKNKAKEALRRLSDLRDQPGINGGSSQKLFRCTGEEDSQFI